MGKDFFNENNNYTYEDLLSYFNEVNTMIDVLSKESNFSDFDDIIKKLREKQKEIEDKLRHGDVRDNWKNDIDLENPKIRNIFSKWYARPWRYFYGFSRGLGNVNSVYRIPNTTFSEWLVWFLEWLRLLEEAITNLEKIINEIIDQINKIIKILDDHEKRITELEKLAHPPATIKGVNGITTTSSGIKDQDFVVSGKLLEGVLQKFVDNLYKAGHIDSSDIYKFKFIDGRTFAMGNINHYIDRRGSGLFIKTSETDNTNVTVMGVDAGFENGGDGFTSELNPPLDPKPGQEDSK